MTSSQELLKAAFGYMNTLDNVNNVANASRKPDEILEILGREFSSNTTPEIKEAVVVVSRFRNRAYELVGQEDYFNNTKQAHEKATLQLKVEFPGFSPEIYDAAFGEAVWLNH